MAAASTTSLTKADVEDAALGRAHERLHPARSEEVAGREQRGVSLELLARALPRLSRRAMALLHTKRPGGATRRRAGADEQQHRRRGRREQAAVLRQYGRPATSTTPTASSSTAKGSVG